MSNPDVVVVAEILRPRGNRGELLAVSQTDVPGRLESLRYAKVRIGHENIPVEIESAWPHKEHWVLKLAGIDTIDAANRFRGADLWVPKAERGQLPDGEFFQTDLIGCKLIDAAGNSLGEVAGWQQYGGPPLMEVRIAGQKDEKLIPFVPQICKQVDLDKKIIRVDLPDGLLEL